MNYIHFFNCKCISTTKFSLQSLFFFFFNQQSQSYTKAQILCKYKPCTQAHISKNNEHNKILLQQYNVSRHIKITVNGFNLSIIFSSENQTWSLEDFSLNNNNNMAVLWNSLLSLFFRILPICSTLRKE